jgi:hypothetical protein
MSKTAPACTSCERPSNNKYNQCPPRMADGRLFTDYRPRCDINFLYPPKDQYLDSYNYRQFLIKNTEKILQQQRRSAYDVAACGPCVEPYAVGTMLPEQTIQTCTKSTCSFATNDPAGLGLGRNYGTERFFFQQGTAPPKPDLAAEHANCCVTPKDAAVFYPIEGIVADDGPGGAGGRLTVPSGGVPLSKI